MGEKQLRIIDWLLTKGTKTMPEAEKEFHAWRQIFYRQTNDWPAPVDRAIIGGFISDCVAYAFAAGYGSALQSLVPELPKDKITSFCVTESGGAHPRAINTNLSPVNSDAETSQSFTLTGKKKYISCANEADLILVAASEGIYEDGKNRIRMVKVDSKAPGVTITPMKEIELVPEISHGTVSFNNVAVREADLLAGDGYLHYIKPFRTIEDLHVTAAVLGYLFRMACRYGWEREIKQQLLGLIVTIRPLALSDPAAPSIHIVTGDLLDRTQELIERINPCWETADKDIRDAWNRDKVLMSIAGKARIQRLDTAWAFYAKKRPG
jgi:acyl-CoA dehydrogenase